jgi:hypothetical protein
VAAHLLDGDLRKLSFHRDGHRVARDSPTEEFGAIVALINELNASGVAWARRLSPRILTELLAVTGSAVANFVGTLDPHAPASFAVAWAGEEQSENWMDTGREYTERWHHQMQIRRAVGAAALLDSRWLEPLLDFSVRALSRAYQSVSAPEGSSVTLRVSGEPPQSWTLRREASAWKIYSGSAPNPSAAVSMEPDVAWRSFFNALSVDEARAAVVIEGDTKLAEPFFKARAVMV